ncbi:MAG: dihydrolipoamide dehydrogenase [Flavobacteriaceae bacterium]|nr:dihydrolipoamide dehydrogenase [Flavobacteriaceae bacterium]|tara:strand:- start:579 stop:1454 length:876 start_codon:yes stop_codon:yes gene_type:complete
MKTSNPLALFNNIFLSALFFLTPFSILSQVKTPQPSPASKIIQTVGLTEITVEFSRPSMKGREIMGELVPYGKIWRTGANENTKISFSDPVKLNGKSLDKGSYAIYTRPGEDMWEVFFYKKSDNWGTPRKWEASEIAVAVEVPVTKLSNAVETFSIWISNLSNNGAKLNIAWENTRISVNVEVPTVDKATASINEVLKKNPKARDYYNAARYYLEENQDLNLAKKWITKAVEMEDNHYWMFRYQALILADLGEIKNAIQAAQKSLELAEENGNNDYVRMNNKSIAEWSAMN